MRGVLFLAGTMLAMPALADDGPFALHGQATFVEQFHPAFRAPFAGPNSLFGGAQGRETFDATLYAGVSPWQGGEAWADIEMDQGFGLSNTLGAAAFPSAEAYKVGKSAPYGRLQRLFLRQTFDLGGDPGGEMKDVEAAANQMAGRHSADTLVFTGGKFSVTDVFDTNAYAHDARADFLNWALIDAGAFDYAADAWGYSYGMTLEWNTGDWSVRGGLFDLSRVPNTTALETDFSQFETVGEVERRFQIGGRDSSLKIMGFLNRGRMGSYQDAVTLTGVPADIAAVRRYRSRGGGSLNWQQDLTDDLGLFVRASTNDGSQEAYEFTDMNNSIAAGLSLKGTSWARGDDTVGVAVETAGIDHAARDYFARGGLGILIGDGRLTDYDRETVAEAYYDAQLMSGVHAALDAQLIANPAYNARRGPVTVLGLRLHGGF